MIYAYAERADLSASSSVLVLLCGIIVLAIGGMILVPITLAARHGRRDQETIRVVAMLWALICLWSALNFTIADFAWSKEYLLRIETGYFNPKDTTGAPAWPWRLWTASAVAYGALVVWSSIQPAERR